MQTLLSKQNSNCYVPKDITVFVYCWLCTVALSPEIRQNILEFLGKHFSYFSRLRLTNIFYGPRHYFEVKYLDYPVCGVKLGGKIHANVN